MTAGSRLATYTLVFFSAPCGRAMATCAAPNDASDGQPARFTLTRARAHASRRAGGRVGGRVGGRSGNAKSGWATYERECLGGGGCGFMCCAVMERMCV